ncbi:exopolysaccharide biosynthesis protein [Sulfitobacter mediterraneus]|uniref:exopolysaccharide biosynthesis protein n=1 Tax=Sulfitobacter mediterraneus TaxID=83219 RepID=UPI001933CD12|nr:exopolysaccharide biosynthesis protein [Sulfitobacter mediterraneus]MBM1633071.1 exopolysaccharide biosynthesis protein [Sulfitobacter mediterraneus]MBM1640795.1 exopolysaccharide biosynthesis protein [Sulfitobacter mediterraneus]MBM1644936.1 exopolysaccharide biosynthesis protein [Sulfitobacter mediterraneus]MBM1648915.1 exopolysaccharide biosynthesis protein [Sulfitobacter mediterraneus]MBM1652936.1 exopolysaccharide biosynthesis protein [Sulfitobacter mediterraneus]
MPAPDTDHRLTEMLDGLEEAGQDRKVSFRDLLRQFGNRAITPFILLIALLMVSPLSGIPGMPSLAAMIIVTMAVQALSGRKRIWLPEILLRQRFRSERLLQAVRWMRKPCAFLDRHSQMRLQFLTRSVMRWITLAICAALPLAWPLLEILPLVTSIGAATVALLVFGLLTHDGVYVLLGYCAVALSIFAGVSLL